MRPADLLEILGRAPIVASVQADAGTSLDDPGTIARLASASLSRGVELFRVEGVEDIRAVSALGKPVVGLIKRSYPGSDVYITPTAAEVGALLQTPVEIIALDATARCRPGDEDLANLMEMIHRGGRLAWADCDGPESAAFAEGAGADVLSTTLCGYTGGPTARGPALDNLRAILESAHIPVVAEGRFTEEWQVRAALQMGAKGVVIGGALNDPHKQTARFVDAVRTPRLVLAFDIGGTWLRCGWFEDWKLVEAEKIALPADPEVRLAWMREHVTREVQAIGISSGGTIDPETRRVIEAKPIIPDHVGTEFSFGDIPTVALNDGHATAYGHACLPQYAGGRVATLALGTGVGFGLVDRGKIWMGPRGGYPRLNDLGFEEVLGGARLEIVGKQPTPEAVARARQAARRAVETVSLLFMPDEIVLCGGVGLADWLDIDLPLSPFGADAGLYGAAALAIWPPI